MQSKRASKMQEVLFLADGARTTTWSASSTPRSREYGHVRDPHSTTYSYRARLLRAALEAQQGSLAGNVAGL